MVNNFIDIDKMKNIIKELEEIKLRKYEFIKKKKYIIKKKSLKKKINLQ
jgi:hypothetical protein